MGKSASGKDSIYKYLLEKMPLLPLILYTTRPRREHEQEGREYHFITPQMLAQMRLEGKLVEERCYQTIEGDWCYCTGAIDFSAGDYLGIGTLQSYEKIRAFYGDACVIPIYIEVEDGVRLQRALDRERLEREPRYEELCRRFLADAKDFSEENLARAGIGRRFANVEFAACAAEIEAYITSGI